MLAPLPLGPAAHAPARWGEGSVLPTAAEVKPGLSRRQLGVSTERSRPWAGDCFTNTPQVCSHPWSPRLSSPRYCRGKGSPRAGPWTSRTRAHHLCQPGLLHACGRNLSLGWGVGASSFPPSFQGSHPTSASIPTHAAGTAAEATQPTLPLSTIP